MRDVHGVDINCISPLIHAGGEAIYSDKTEFVLGKYWKTYAWRKDSEQFGYSFLGCYLDLYPQVKHVSCFGGHISYSSVLTLVEKNAT